MVNLYTSCNCNSFNTYKVRNTYKKQNKIKITIQIQIIGVQ